LTQARKKKVLEEVRKQRQRRTIISIAIVVVLIGTIGYGVYALTQTKGGGNFPFTCLGSELTTVHVHPWLRISINTGAGITNVTVPTAIGILNPQISNGGIASGGSCFEPMHTHDSSGIIHIEAGSVTSQYTLGAFFQIWQVTYGTVSVNGASRPVVFNNTDIFGYRTDSTHTLSLLVDNQNFAGAYASLDLTHYDYCSSSSNTPPCYPTAGGTPQWPGSGGYPYGTGHTVVINYA
jgi:hypothetical protein